MNDVEGIANVLGEAAVAAEQCTPSTFFAGVLGRIGWNFALWAQGHTSVSAAITSEELNEKDVA